MIISAKGLGYRTNDGRFALGPVDLELDGGSLVLARGDNGSGKSTLLRLLSCRGRNLPGTIAGKLDILGQDALASDASAFFPALASMGPRPDAELFRATVREEIAFALENRGLSREECRRRADKAAEELGIGRLLGLPARKLSGGEQRLVILAALLALKPRAMLLDEPLSSLSADSARLAARALRAHADEGNLVVVVEHAFAALDGLVDRELVLERGKIRFDSGSAKSLRATGYREIPRERDGIGARNDKGLRTDENPAMVARQFPEERIRLSADRIDFCHGDSPILALDGLSIPNGISLLSGGNGAGKSTLLRILRGLAKPARGRVRFDGTEIDRVSAVAGLALVMQESAHQLVALTAREEIALAVKFRPANEPRGREVRTHADDIAARFSLESLLDSYPGALSTGERRRLALATAFARGADFMLLDEADSGLDGRGKETLLRELGELARRGGGALFASHEPAFLNGLAGREFALERGARALRERKQANA